MVCLVGIRCFGFVGCWLILLVCLDHVGSGRLLFVIVWLLKFAILCIGFKLVLWGFVFGLVAFGVFWGVVVWCGLRCCLLRCCFGWLGIVLLLICGWLC